MHKHKQKTVKKALIPAYIYCQNLLNEALQRRDLSQFRQGMKLAVLGAGQMGSGIAQVAAQVAKIPTVLLYDNNAQQLKQQVHRIADLLERAVSRGKIQAEERDQALGRLKTTTELEQVSDCDFVVEVREVHARLHSNYSKRPLTVASPLWSVGGR